MSSSDEEFFGKSARNKHGNEFVSLFGSLLRLAPYILVPLAIINARTVINWIIRFVRGLRVRLSRPRQEIFFSIPTILFLFYLLIQLFSFNARRPSSLSNVDLSSVNYFWLTRTRPESPSYVIRNQLRDYLQDLSASDHKLADLITRRKNKGWGEESASLTEIIDPKDPLEVKMVLLTSLSQSLRITKTKEAYMEWGPRAVFPSVLKGLIKDFKKSSGADAALPEPLNDPALLTSIEDDLGSATEERFVSALPYLSWRHLVILLTMGILGGVRLKSRWPVIASVLVVLSILHDAFVLYYYPGSTNVPIFDALYPRDRYSLRLEKLLLLQSHLYAILSFLALLFDLRTWNEQDDPERIQLIRTLSSVETLVGLLQLIRLQRTTVMLDEQLRRHFWEHYRLLEVQNQRLFADEEFRSAQANLRRTHNMDDLISQNQDFLEQTFLKLNDTSKDDGTDEAATVKSTNNLDRRKNKKKQQ